MCLKASSVKGRITRDRNLLESCFFPGADTKYSVAENVGRECQESSVSSPVLAGAPGPCLEFSLQKISSLFCNTLVASEERNHLMLH